MNRTHSVVWSSSLNCLVVVSELAKRGAKFASLGFKVKGSNSKALSADVICMRSRSGILSLALFGVVSFVPEHATAATYSGSTCTNTNGGTTLIGQQSFAPANGQPSDGSGTWSSVGGCQATGNGVDAATVFGSYSSVTGVGGMALGFSAAAAKWASAAGLDATATGVGSTALGFGARALNNNSVAIGGAGGNGTTALTVANSTTANADGAIAIGSNATKGANVVAADGIAIGGQSRVNLNGTAGVALGKNTQVIVPDSVAIGSNSSADSIHPTWNNITAGAVVSGRSLTLTSSSLKVVAFGDRQLQGVADGGLTATSTDGVNGAQLFAVAQALNSNIGALGVAASAALGAGAAYNSATAAWTAPSFVLSSGTVNNVGAALNNLDALGTKYFKSNSTGAASSATGANSVAIGPAAVASQQNAIALGNTASASGVNAIAIGANSLATGSIAVGNTSLAGGGGASFGDFADAGGTPSSVATTVTKGTALGNAAVVQTNDGVALGSGSIASTVANVAGYDALTNTSSTATSSTWRSTLGAVSVGGGGRYPADYRLGRRYS